MACSSFNIQDAQRTAKLEARLESKLRVEADASEASLRLSHNSNGWQGSMANQRDRASIGSDKQCRLARGIHDRLQFRHGRLIAQRAIGYRLGGVRCRHKDRGG